MKKGPPGPPPKVVKGIVEDLAHKKTRKPGATQKIADDWAVSLQVVHDIANREKRDVMALREGVAERAFVLGARLQDKIAATLEDPKKMAATPFKDMARGLECITNAGVTAMDGHQPTIGTINFAFIKEQKVKVENYDERLARRMKELSAPKIIDVTPA